MEPLDSPFDIGGVHIANRVVLAPLAGVGNWFVRLQAKRYGAGLVVSEMVSSLGLHYGNQRTRTEFLRIHPDEHPVSIQLYGHDARAMAHAAEIVAGAGADIIDLNMGCPVRKVVKRGAGASLLGDHRKAVLLAKAAAEGGGLPVTVKLRSGRRAGSDEGTRLAHRLVEEAGVSAITFHPRPAERGHGGEPDYRIARALSDELPVPMIVTGGATSAGRAREIYALAGADAVMVARASLGNPWIFSELLEGRAVRPSLEEVVDELLWVIAAARQHFSEERASRFLRKFYPWYLRQMDIPDELALSLANAGTLEHAERALRRIESAGCTMPRAA